jgi:hypothetical protein
MLAEKKMHDAMRELKQAKQDNDRREEKSNLKRN